ncbi:MAG: hypothetical protein WC227_00465 [Patescibacteria group bacterium]|jgi:tetratricopeptide (TPR) repeat protein
MNADEIKKIRTERNPEEETLWRKIAKWVLIVAIILVFIELITKPLRHHWADDYLERGDQYLIQKKYLSAELEYQKSAIFYKTSLAEDRQELANQAQTDVLKLKPFLQSKNISKAIEDFETATAKYTHYDALRVSKELYEKGELQLALVALDNDPDKANDEHISFDKIINKAILARLELSSNAKQKYRE